MSMNFAAYLSTLNRTLKLWEVLLFCIAAGILTTLLHGYQYGTSDQLEQIPLILRKMDSGYISNDYFISAMSAMSPRIYYVKLIARLAQFASLPALFFWLTCLQHIGVALVTFIAARRMFLSGDLAAILSVGFALGVAGPFLGGASHLFFENLVPKSLILFLALWAAWEGINLRPLRCAVIASVASVIHPQVSLLGAMIGFGTAGTSLFFGWGGETLRSESFVRRWFGFATGGFLLACVYYFLWLLPMRGGELSADSLDYLIHFRAPHHHTPSYFALSQYLLACSFLLASFILWRGWLRDEATNKPLAKRIGIAGGVVLLLLFCGWFFVEVIPQRFFMTLQAFRTVLFVKWFGLMLLGGTVAGLLVRKSSDARPTGNWFYLSALGQAQPALMLLGTMVEWIRGKIASRIYLILFAFAALIQVAALAKFRGARELLALYAILTSGLILLAMSSQLRRLLVSSGVVASALLLALIYQNVVQAGRINKIAQGYVEGIASKEERSFEQAVLRVSVFARQNTSPGALFITPPDFGRFRIEARRALVVDFKTFPFYEKDIVEWRKRVVDCYGKTSGVGWAAMHEMKANFRRIGDDELLRISNRYNAPFAILYNETETGFPVLYADSDYKLISVSIPDPN